MFDYPLLPEEVAANVRAALGEDVGEGDLTAMLVPAGSQARAEIITREAGVFCGRPWVEETFRQLDPATRLHWAVNDGSKLAPGERLLTLEGSARTLLTGERTALNFMQLLSGVASRAHHYAQLVAGTSLTLLDTRKTLPGLRAAQKYAVRCGGCGNHRKGLFDAFLIKENHIAAAGSIAAAVASAREQAPQRPVEVEVENLEELQQALAASADLIMLDEFSLGDLRTAVATVAGRAPLEASGSIDEASLPAVAATGVNYVSIGALTKHVSALDLSLRLQRLEA